MRRGERRGRVGVGWVGGVVERVGRLLDQDIRRDQQVPRKGRGAEEVGAKSISY